MQFIRAKGKSAELLRYRTTSQFTKDYDQEYQIEARPEGNEEFDSSDFIGQTSPRLDSLSESYWPYRANKLNNAFQQHNTHHLHSLLKGSTF